MPRRRLTIGGNGPCCAPRTLWLAAPVVAARGRRKRLPLVSPGLHVAGTLLFILVPWGGFGLPGDLWPLRRAGQNLRHLMARFHARRRAPPCHTACAHGHWGQPAHGTALGGDTRSTGGRRPTGGPAAPTHSQNPPGDLRGAVATSPKSISLSQGPELLGSVSGWPGTGSHLSAQFSAEAEPCSHGGEAVGKAMPAAGRVRAGWPSPSPAVTQQRQGSRRGSHGEHILPSGRQGLAGTRVFAGAG